MFGGKVKYPEGRSDRLWFYISDTVGEFVKQNLVVDGLGVTATVREPDIGATNGIIHVVDKVLGIPSSTINQKLSEDPMLRYYKSLRQQKSHTLLSLIQLYFALYNLLTF